MKHKFLFGAMAALMMSACSQDEVTSFRQDGIAYSVVAGKHTRAADSYCNTDLPKSFKIWAKTSDGLYIDGDKIVHEGGGWTDSNGTRYWPENEPLDFFAEVNGDTEFRFNNGSPIFEDFVVKDKVGEQLDLMYAVKKKQDKEDGTVQLNFRHALSQICFKAHNKTKNMRVEIKGVSVGHLANKGTYTFPADDTDENYEYHDDATGSTIPSLNRGSWSTPVESSYTNEYEVTFDKVALEPKGEITNLTCPGEGHKNGFANVLTLLPQTVDPWDPTQKKKDWNGAYFLVDVILSNVVRDDSKDSSNGNLHTGKVAIPVSVNWEEGYRYIYTFVFDEGGSGGWTPNPENPEPVLTTIKYDVTVDDFIPGDSDVDMDVEYTYNCTLNLHDNYGDPEKVGKVKIGSNNTSYPFTLTKDYTPKREGFKFLGWATFKGGEVAYKEDASILINFEESSIDLYAVWEQETKLIEFTLTYHANGDGVENMPDSEVKEAEATCSFIVSKTEPTREGYAFLGWVDSDGEEYEAETEIVLDKTLPSKDLYAVWKATTTYTLIFNDNNPSNSLSVTDLPTKIEVNSSEESHTFTVPNKTPKVGNWVFLGYANEPDATEATYEIGDDVVVNRDESPKTIYVVWGTKGGGGAAGGGTGTDW